MDVATLAIAIDSRDAKSAERDLDNLGKQGVKTERQIDGFAATAKKGFGGVALAAGAALAALGSIGVAISTIREFESSLSRLGAITGATSGELTALRDVARDLGATTEFSATQAADGLTFLGMAGFTATESIAAIPAVLDLATAASIGLGSAADITSNIMSGFGIAAQDAASVTDILAAASSSANTDVSQLGQAMSTVAPISAALGIDLADTAASIGVLSDAGIQGARAGTALRGVLASLAGPTTEATQVLQSLGLSIDDINPATNDLSDVMAKLNGASLSTADAIKIFGREAASGALVLVEGADRLEEFGDELRNVDGAAADMASTIRDNLGGDIDSLQSAVSGLILAFGDAGLTAILRGVVGALTGVTRAVTTVVDLFGGFVDGAVAAGASLLGLSSGSKELAAASISAALGINEELKQANDLAISLSGGTTVSREVAAVKLEQAKAHLALADAQRQERLEAIQTSEEYQRFAGRATSLFEELQVAQKDLADQEILDAQGLESTAGFYASEVARITEEIQNARAAQAELIGDAAELSPEFIRAQETIAVLEAQLGSTTSQMVSLGGETAVARDVTVDLSAAANGITFDGAITSAGFLANDLGVSLAIAEQLNAVLNANAGIETPTGGRNGPALGFGVDGSNLATPLATGLGFDNARSGNPIASIPNFSAPALSGVGGSGSGSSRSSGGGSSSGVSDAQREAERAQTEGRREATRILEGLRTETEIYQDELEALADLERGGFLTTEQFAQAQSQLNQEFAQTQFEDSGLSGFVDTLSQGLSSVESFGDAFGVLKDTAISAIQDIAAEAARANLTSLLSGGSVSGGGGILGGLGSAFAGFFDEGGRIPSGQFGGVAEFGPEIVNGQLVSGPADVMSRTDTAALINGRGGSSGGDQNLHVTVSMDEDGNWQSRVAEISSDVSRGQIRQAAPAITAQSAAVSRMGFQGNLTTTAERNG